MISRGCKRFIPLVLAIVLPIVLGGCDDPSQEQIDAAGGELAELTKKMNLTRFGPYTFAGVKYLNLKNTQSELKHGLQAKILHNDKAQKTAAKAAGTLAQTQKPKSYYVKYMCPPASFIQKYGDVFRIRISIYSVYFNRQFSVDCN